MKLVSMSKWGALCALACGGAFAANGVLAGSGTVASPWLVTDYADLKAIGTGSYTLGGIYRLTADIDAAASATENCDAQGVCAGFTPIGAWKTSFTGNFQGAGHVIRNLYENRPTADEAGLFGAASGTIDSLGLENVRVTGHGDVGGLVGYSRAMLRAVYVTGVVTGDTSRVGGVAGWNGGTLQASFAAATVRGDSAVGGLAGQSGGKIYDCYAQGRVSGIRGIGGLVGRVDGELRRSYAVSEVRGDSLVGAVVGEVFSGYNLAGPWTGSVAESYWSSEAFGQEQSAGSARPYGLTVAGLRTSSSFAGWDWNLWSQGAGASFPVLPWVRNVAQAIPDTLDALPDTTGSMDAALIATLTNNDLDPMDAGARLTARWVDSSAWLRLYQVGTVRTADTLWGAFGQVRLHAEIAIASYEDLKKIAVDGAYPPYGTYTLMNDIDASESATERCDGQGVCAGFAPIGSNAQPFTGSFDGQGHVIQGLHIRVASGKRVGLFAKTDIGARIENLGLVNADVQGDTLVGPLVGDHRGVIRSCYATGQVQGKNVVGGLVGDVDGVAGDTTVGVLERSYAAVRVQGQRNLGGLAGAVWDGVLRDVYATGSVQGDIGVGGLAGVINAAYVEHALALGPVFGRFATGGLVGWRIEGNVTDAYWNREVSRLDTSAGSLSASGLITAQLRTAATYAGWDMGTRWELQAGVSYPILRGLDNAPSAFPSVDDAATAEPEVEGFAASSPAAPLVGRWLEYRALNAGKDSLYHYYQIGAVRAADDTVWGGVAYAAIPSAPIAIASYTDLKKIGNDVDYPLWGDYAQTADIDAAASAAENCDANNVCAGFNPIGTEAVPFTGRFHGKGFAIRNLHIARPQTQNVGLFGVATQDAMLDSVTLWNAVVAGNDQTGALAGWFLGDSIHACHATATVRGASAYAGGLVGRSQTVLTNSSATGLVEGTDYFIGGLVGGNEGLVEKSYAAAVVRGGHDVGGLTGWNEGRVVRSYAVGRVSGSSDVAGLAMAGEESRIEECYAASVSRGGFGVVGRSWYAVTPAERSYWDAERAQTGLDAGMAVASGTGSMLQQAHYADWDFATVWTFAAGTGTPRLRGMDNAPQAFDDEMSTLPDTTGGVSVALLASLTSNDVKPEQAGMPWVARWVDSTATERIYQVGVLLGTDTLWGGVGRVTLNSIAIASYADLKKIGVDAAYPLTGKFRLTKNIDASASASENCDANGVCAGFTPIGTYAQPFRGSLRGAGFAIRGLRVNHPALADVGLFGRLKGAWIDSLGVENSEIQGSRNVGGLAGWADSSVLLGSYFTGTVRGNESYAGGLLGYQSYDNALLYCHALGRVEGVNYAAGIVGENHGMIQNSFAQMNVGTTTGRMGSAIAYSSWINASGTVMNSYATGLLRQGSAAFWLRTGGVRYGTSFADSLALGDAALRSAASYAGWDLQRVWQVQEGASYPYLRGLPGQLFALPTAAAKFDKLPLVAGFYVDQPGTPLVGHWTGDSCLNDAQDSLYKYYQIGAVRGLTDTLWGGVSFMARPVGDIVIASYADLKKIGTNADYPVWGKYRVTADIDASASAKENSGAGFAPIASFSGTLHGGGHVIRNLSIQRGSEQYIGLIAKLASGSRVDSLELVNATVHGNYHVGALVGFNQGEIKVCHTQGKVEGVGSVGGLVGSNEGTILHSSSFVQVSGSSDLGGLAGSHGAGLISFSFATGAVSGAKYIGGLVGSGYGNATIRSSYATGSVTGYSYGGAGGVTGFFSGEIYDSYATGSVFSEHQPGGLQGNISSYSYLRNTYSVGRVGGREGAGLLGYVNTSYYQYHAPVGGYWDKQSSGQDSSQGMPNVVGLSTSAMRLQTSFVGWDFVKTWSIANTISYPYLQGIDNAPFAFADTLYTLASADLASLLANDYDPETARTALIVRVETLAGGTTDSVSKLTFPAGAKKGDTLRITYRVGEVRSTDTLWGSRAQSVLLLQKDAPVPTVSDPVQTPDFALHTVGGTLEASYRLAQAGNVQIALYNHKGELLYKQNLGYQRAGNHQSLIASGALGPEALIAVLQLDGKALAQVMAGGRF